jgi:hypothetical protein
VIHIDWHQPRAWSPAVHDVCLDRFDVDTLSSGRMRPGLGVWLKRDKLVAMRCIVSRPDLRLLRRYRRS